MKLKIHCLLVAVVLPFLSAIAQNQNVYYLKDNGKRVSTRDSADYIRIVSEPDSGTTLYNVKQYYANGKPMLVGKSSTIDDNTFDGQVLSFYKNRETPASINLCKGLFARR